MAYFYLLSILAARERVYLATPYFIRDEPLKAALMRHARAGVDVRLLLPGPEIDNPFVRYGKFGVVDSQWSVVGSPNLHFVHASSMKNASGILDAEFGRRLEEDFLRDLTRSEELTLETWRQRGLWPRLRSFISRAVDRQS